MQIHSEAATLLIEILDTVALVIPGLSEKVAKLRPLIDLDFARHEYYQKEPHVFLAIADQYCVMCGSPAPDPCEDDPLHISHADQKERWAEAAKGKAPTGTA